MEKVYVSLGSNLSNPLRQIEIGIYSISKIPKSKLICTSSFYKTSPYGLKKQPDYFNMVAFLKTSLDPKKLLYYLQKIEKNQGRIKNIKWGPRIIDIDILLFGKLILNTSFLTVPHYDLKNRFFILFPLLEINPDICLPNGDKIINILKI